MSNQPGSRVRRLPLVAAEELLLGDGRWDYADAFEVRVSERDRRTAEQWVRYAFEQAPWAVRWTARIAQRDLLRMQLGPDPDPHHVVGWQVRTSLPDVVHLEAQSPLLRGAIVARRTEPTRVVASTYLSYRRPQAARAVWAVVAPVHRKVARYLLARAAAGAAGVLTPAVQRGSQTALRRGRWL